MNEGKASDVLDPVVNAEVLTFGTPESARSVLDQIVRKGARTMLQAALEDEVNAFLELNSTKVDGDGRRLVVRNGYMPSRELVTGAGNLEVSQPRVRDKSSDLENRVKFSSSILPPYLRRSKAIDELIPWLYLKGISTGDFSEALQSLTGGPVDAVSATTIVRLKETWAQDYEAWNKRDLSSKQYAYTPYGFARPVEYSQMYHELPRDSSFWRFLFSIDRDLAETARQKACSCGGRLHRANYPRKPRGGPEDLPDEYDLRLSFCCDRDGCRKRTTPPSVRFLGPKVYLGAVVVLLSAMRQGPTPRRIAELTRLFGASRRTIARWQVYWQEIFPRTPFWKIARGRLAPVVEIDSLPRTLTEVFLREGELTQAWGKLLRFLSPITITQGLLVEGIV